MAQFELSNFLDIGTQSYHTYTSWQVTYDLAGKRIIDQSLRDPINLHKWISPLPDGNGGYHADLPAVYLFVRVHTLDTDSPWFYAGHANQNDQSFVVTSNRKIINTINSLLAGIN